MQTTPNTYRMEVHFFFVQAPVTMPFSEELIKKFINPHISIQDFHTENKVIPKNSRMAYTRALIEKILNEVYVPCLCKISVSGGSEREGSARNDTHASGVKRGKSTLHCLNWVIGLVSRCVMPIIKLNSPNWSGSEYAAVGVIVRRLCWSGQCGSVGLVTFHLPTVRFYGGKF